MKKITLLILLLIVSGSFAQVLNEPANWPNTNWIVSGTYESTALLNDPTLSDSFTFDDDAAGSASDDDVMAESPVIDLSAAFSAGETQLLFTGNYMHRDIGGSLSLDYWDADTAGWVELFQFEGTTTPNTYASCGNMFPFEAGLVISGFTTNQLSNFKYRFAYDDFDGWQYGWCIQDPVVTSVGAMAPNCDAVVTSPSDGATGIAVDAQITWSAATGFPEGYYVSIGTTAGGTDVLDNFDNGTSLSYDPTGVIDYSTTYYVTIIPYNGVGPATGCASSSFSTETNPNTTVICANGAVNTTYCYDSNDTTQYVYTSDDGSPLVVVFNAGQVENNYDELVILDSDGSILYNGYGNSGDLTGLVFTSTGDNISVGITSDFSISCQSSGYTQWDFDVSCVDTTAVPNCNAALIAPINGEIDVNENTDITWSPATIFVTGYKISIGTTSGGTDIADSVDVGNVLTYTPTATLAYSTTYYVTIVPYNDNGDATGCTEESFTTRDDPNQIVDCASGVPVNTTYCYTNSDTTQFNYASSDGSPLSVVFNAGQVENNWDELIVLDSDGTELYNGYGNSGDLTGLTFTSSGSTITIGINSDSIIGCDSNGYTPWDFDVSCVDTTAVPNCDSVLTLPLNGEIDVNEDEDLNWSAATQIVTGYKLSMGTSSGGTDVLDAFDVGDVLTYDPGTLQFATTYYVTIVPYNDNGDATGCIEESFTTRNDPNVIVDCEGAPVNTTYCYGNNDTMQFSFTSSSGFPLNIFFNAGQVENNWDELIILDSDGVTDLNAGTPYGNGGDLTGLTYTSTGDNLTVIIQSDGIISCESSGYTPWDFDVWCQTCVPQTATYTVVGECDPVQEFTIDVDISDLGSVSTLTLSDDQGSPDQVTTETGIVTFGPYVANTYVTITVASEDTNCTLTSDPLTFVCPPPPNDCSIVYAGEDTSVSCESPSTDLTASFMTSGVDPNVYEVNALDSCPTPPVIGGVPSGIELDDRWSDVIDLTFDFCFFGNTYNQMVIGANGLLSFDTSQANGYCPWAFDESVPDPGLPLNAIYGAYHDIDPSVCGNIEYFVLGVAPLRQFVVNFVSTCHFSCNELETTQQIILYESSNNIDINIFDKPTCTTWNSGNAVIGVQNIDGTVGFTPPDRNTGPWSATNEFWRFSNAGDPNYTFEWLDGTTVVGTTATITVAPDVTTTYTASVSYTQCDGSVKTVTDDVIVDYTDAEINIAQPDAFEVCVDGDQPVFDFDLTTQDEIILNGLSDFVVTYHLTMEDAEGNLNAITNPTAYTNISSPQTVYARVTDVDFENCFEVTSFDLIVTTKPFTATGECVNQQYNLTIEPVDNSFDVSQSTFTLYDDMGTELYSNSLGDNVFIIDTSDFTEPMSGSTYNFVVEVIDSSGCTVTKELLIETVSCIFPQGISPNNDGFNDTFELSNYVVDRLEIYNRNGMLVYSKDNYTDEWYGQSDDNEELPVGTYFYVMKYQGSKERTGWVYINRE